MLFVDRTYVIEVPGTLIRLLKSQGLEKPRSVFSTSVGALMHSFVSAGHLRRTRVAYSLPSACFFRRFSSMSVTIASKP